jgi:ribosomal protein S18 acetylase RimI-like enzyme
MRHRHRLRGLRTSPRSFDRILDLLGQIDADYRSDRAIEPGRYLHLFLLGVDEQFARRKIGQHLVGVCLANGAGRGYTTAVTEATNLVSQHIFRQHGFQTRATRSYRDYRFVGMPTFASIAEHGGPMTMDRRIALDDD